MPSMPPYLAFELRLFFLPHLQMFLLGLSQNEQNLENSLSFYLSNKCIDIYEQDKKLKGRKSFLAVLSLKLICNLKCD